MFYEAKEGGEVKVGRTDMDYVAFGRGQKDFI